jgi:biotin carboxyl carrier protein
MRDAPHGLQPRDVAELIIAASHGAIMRDVLEHADVSASERHERQLKVVRQLWALLFDHANEPALAVKSPSSGSRPVAPRRTPRHERPPKKRARGAVFKVVLGLVAVFLVIGGIKVMQIVKLVGMGKSMVPPPSTVTSAKVEQANWAPTLSAVGSVTAVQGATISAELPGTVLEIGFQSGTPVKKGDVLLKLDAAAEQAQMRSAQADAELAKADFERARDLAARKVISQAELDTAASRYTQRQGAVDNMKSVIAKKEMRAPFDGIAGIREVNPGQMVQVGQRLVSLQALDQVYVDFSLPQQQLGEVQPGLTVKVTTDAIGGREFEGKLTAVNSAIDPPRAPLGAGDARESRPRAASRNVRPRAGSAAAGEDDALHPGDGRFVRAVRQFRLRDREESRRKDEGRIARHSAAVHPHRRISRRLHCGH